MSTLRFALVGCGRIARKHTQVLAEQLEDTELVAVCDTQIDRARKYGEQYGIPYFEDMHQMMQNMGENIDAICILTPSGMHAQHTIEMAPYGKHLVVEKPMALTLPDADRMIEACDSNGIRLFVVKQNRYNVPVVKLREAVEAGRFGKNVMGTIRVRWCRDQQYYDQDDWRGTWKYDGGVITNQASHHIDLLEWMMGDVESVFAYGETQLVDIETEDTVAAVLRFTSGALGIIEATTATRPVDLEGSISILGSGGTVEIGGFAVNQMKVWNFVQSQPGDETVLDQFQQNPPDVYGFGHLEYMRDVVQSIRKGSKALVDGLEGRRSLELIWALYESMETGKQVSMRFNPSHCKLGQ